MDCIALTLVDGIIERFVHDVIDQDGGECTDDCGNGTRVCDSGLHLSAAEYGTECEPLADGIVCEMDGVSSE